MKKCKIFLIVAMVLASMAVFSQSRPLEIGIPLGLGFYWGTPEMDLASGAHVNRAYKMALSNTEGAELGYSIARYASTYALYGGGFSGCGF